MQLPGMTTEPLRLTVDITWWAPDDDFSCSRRLWSRSRDGSTWQLEDMATTGSPIRLLALPGRWAEIAEQSGSYFVSLVENSLPPFSSL